MSKPKLFISQPMRGLSDDDIKERRKQLFKPFKDKYDLIDSYITEEPPNPENRTWLLGESIKLMGDADLVIFASNWTTAEGCRIERLVCALYGIPYVEEDYYVFPRN